MKKQGGSDIGGGLLLMLFILLFPIMILVWICQKISKPKGLNNSTIKIANEPKHNESHTQKKNSNHFKWLDGKTDKLEIDEVSDIVRIIRR